MILAIVVAKCQNAPSPMSKPRFIPHWRSVISYLRNPKTDWKPKLGLVIAVIYLITPFDFAPDFIPILGWLDDIGALSFVAMWFLRKVSQMEQDIEQPIQIEKGL